MSQRWQQYYVTLFNEITKKEHELRISALSRTSAVSKVRTQLRNAGQLEFTTITKVI